MKDFAIHGDCEAAGAAGTQHETFNTIGEGLRQAGQLIRCGDGEAPCVRI